MEPVWSGDGGFAGGVPGADVEFRVGVVERADAEIVPNQRVDELRLTIEAVGGRLAFPATVTASDGWRDVQTTLAFRADQAQRSGLIFGLLMCQAPRVAVVLAHICMLQAIHSLRPVET